MKKAAGATLLALLPAVVFAAEGPAEKSMLRAVGRLLHIDDDERLDAYPLQLGRGQPPRLDDLSSREQRLIRMLVSSLTSLNASARFDEAVAEVWAHPQVRAELIEMLGLLRERVPYLDYPLGVARCAARHSLSVHTRRDLCGVWCGRRRKAAHVADRCVVGAELANRPLCFHAR